MSKEEKLSKLLGAIETLDEPTTLTDFSKQADMHFSTAEDMLNFFQLAQDFPYKIRIMKIRKQKMVIKEPNLESSNPFNVKLDKIIKLLESMNKKMKK